MYNVELKLKFRLLDTDEPSIKRLLSEKVIKFGVHELGIPYHLDPLPIGLN